MNRHELLAPLPESAWSDKLSADLTGHILNIHRMIAHNPELMTAYAPLRNYIVKDSALTERQRELLILRTGHTMQSDYEWTHHVVRGRAAGLTDEEIERVKTGAEATGWTVAERTLLRCADEMRKAQKLSIETAATLQAELGDAALLDAIFTIGVYLTLGTILKTFDVPLEETIRAL